jgi:hypothetical protein
MIEDRGLRPLWEPKGYKDAIFLIKQLYVGGARVSK